MGGSLTQRKNLEDIPPNSGGGSRLHAARSGAEVFQVAVDYMQLADLPSSATEHFVPSAHSF